MRAQFLPGLGATAGRIVEWSELKLGGECVVVKRLRACLPRLEAVLWDVEKRGRT
jgi:hypothetical protein